MGSRPGTSPSRPGTVGARPPAGRQVSPRPGAGAGFRARPVTSHPETAHARLAEHTEAAEPPARAVVATRPVVPQVQHEVVPSGADVPPSAGRAVADANMEELEPIQVTAYLASSAPVPDHEVIVERGSNATTARPAPQPVGR